MRYIAAAMLSSLSLLAAEAVFTPAQATQQLFCSGRMDNGWGYRAEFVNGQFTQVRWERSGQPPQTSSLSFYSTNAAGQPVYRGSFQAATAVTLVDLSAGNVQSGSQISVGVEEWGWSRGSCSLSSAGGGSSGSTSTLSMLQQNLIGLEAQPARDWMRQNNIFFSQTMEHTDDRVIERWNKDRNTAFDVVIVDGIVSDVVQAR